MTTGLSTAQARARVVEACARYGQRSIIALAGVPGTGKSYIAEKAAEDVAGDPLRVRTCQFHPSYSYEEFIEGVRPDPATGVSYPPGMLMEWNQRALADPGERYVLLIDELTRADISTVFGEIFTYIEYRDRSFLPLYSRSPKTIARNLVVMATYNPLDQSAITMDHATIRRLRVIPFLPSTVQLREMLGSNGVDAPIIAQLAKVFDECAKTFPDTFESEMPFGHGIFADVESETPDLYDLWHERIVRLLRRPAASPHPFVEIIEAHYPWRTSAHKQVASSEEADDGGEGATGSDGDIMQAERAAEAEGKTYDGDLDVGSESEVIEGEVQPGGEAGSTTEGSRTSQDGFDEL